MKNRHINRNRFPKRLLALFCGSTGNVVCLFLYTATSSALFLEIPRGTKLPMLHVSTDASVIGFNCNTLFLERAHAHSALNGTGLQNPCKRVSVSHGKDWLSAHLKEIEDLFQQWVEVALFVEARSTSQVSVLGQLAKYVASAPPGWEALQLRTSNGFVSRHGTRLSDSWISWFPDHWGTSIYLLNRTGMQKILVASSLRTRRSLLEILFSHVTTYTLASPTIELPNNPPGDLAHPRKVVVLESILVKSLLDLDMEIKWLSEDYGCLKLVEPSVEWVVRVVASTEDLASECEGKLLLLNNHSNFVYSLEVGSGQFNKFELAQQRREVFANYLYVLLKDSDQRLCGFPWRSFTSRIGDAVITGPLRQSRNEYLSSGKGGDTRQWFKFHDGHMWKSNKYAPNEYAEIVPLRVSFLEQYFVVMQGTFASWFFSMLPDPFLLQPSSWGIDIVWCGAAKSYGSSHYPCRLIPTISLHEDKMSYKKDRRMNVRGTEEIQEMKHYEAWKNYSRESIEFAAARNSTLVWERCSKFGYRQTRNLSYCLSNL